MVWYRSLQTNNVVSKPAFMIIVMAFTGENGDMKFIALYKALHYCTRHIIFVQKRCGAGWGYHSVITFIRFQGNLIGVDFEWNKLYVSWKIWMDAKRKKWDGNKNQNYDYGWNTNNCYVFIPFFWWMRTNNDDGFMRFFKKLHIKVTFW